MITRNDVAAYERDGVICLRQAFDPTWVERMRVAVERDLASPGPHATNFAEGSTACWVAVSLNASVKILSALSSAETRAIRCVPSKSMFG